MDDKSWETGGQAPLETEGEEQRPRHMRPANEQEAPDSEERGANAVGDDEPDFSQGAQYARPLPTSGDGELEEAPIRWSVRIEDDEVVLPDEDVSAFAVATQDSPDNPALVVDELIEEDPVDFLDDDLFAEPLYDPSPTASYEDGLELPAVVEELPTFTNDAAVADVPLSNDVSSGFEPSVGTDATDSAAYGEVQLPHTRRRRWPLVLAVLLVVGLAGAYVAGALFFARYFLPQTSLNGADVSMTSIEEAAAAYVASGKEVGLELSGHDFALAISGDQIDATYDVAAFEQAVSESQQPWLWPLSVASTHTLDIKGSVSYDRDKLEDIVEKAVAEHNKQATPPQDASISYDKKNAHYVVEQDVPGTTLDATLVVKQAHEAIAGGRDKVDLGDDVLVPPAVTADDKRLNDAADAANSCLDATQVLMHDGKKLITLNAKRLHKYVSLGDDLKVSVDEDRLREWAQGALSRKYDTVGTERSYTRPDGKKVVVSDGTYGWNLDGAAIAAEIADNVRAGVPADVELSFKQEAGVWTQDGADWGDTYVDIDLTEQYVRYYRDGKLIWESPCVSGKVTDGHATPTGVYFINSNMETGNVELRGEIDPKTKEPEYISYVKYWMPFLNNGYALHDADWRASFGGDIYYDNGSHGCINLPPEKAAALWDLVGVGTPVVCHD